ncbi:hypothetical protein HK103_001007 [Boothiomyces macroporosus]|uniref:Uncharacterized protein n=1 Tax=Boothiomyces macroporosus TaxID=261099 RepID=A0AAD5UEN9_9FUNG|nr:hypothetical protein HK103_001007 [Boothiomyces macroporosus]
MAVRFSDKVQVVDTHHKSDYDRSSIEVEPLTQTDVYILLELRKAFNQHTMYLEYLRNMIESKKHLNINAPEFVPRGYFMDIQL